MNQTDIFEKRHALYLTPSASTIFFLRTCMVIGFATFVMGIVTDQHVRTWGGFLLNAMLFFSVSLGGAAFGNMQDAIGAKWGRPIKRLHEAFSSFLPVCAGLLCLFLLSVRFGF